MRSSADLRISSSGPCAIFWFASRIGLKAHKLDSFWMKEFGGTGMWSLAAKQTCSICRREFSLCKLSRAGLKQKCPEIRIAQESDPQHQFSCLSHLFLLAYSIWKWKCSQFSILNGIVLFKFSSLFFFKLAFPLLQYLQAVISLSHLYKLNSEIYELTQESHWRKFKQVISSLFIIYVIVTPVSTRCIH